MTIKKVYFSVDGSQPYIIKDAQPTDRLLTLINLGIYKNGSSFFSLKAGYKCRLLIKK